MEGLIVRTLLAVQPSMIQDKHCFEARPLPAKSPARSARVCEPAGPWMRRDPRVFIAFYPPAP